MRATQAASALLCIGLFATNVHGMGRGSDPTQTPVADPQTQRATNVWKLAGFFPSPNNVSGVQIAPSWVLGAKHSTPGSGSYFANAYGTAPIAECHYIQAERPGNPNNQSATECLPDRPDLALCRLSRPITAAPVDQFPVLVEDPIVLAGTKSLQSLARDLGSFLSVGYGTPDLGLPRYAWGDLLGMPVDPQASPGTLGLTRLTAYRNGGDSGSPTFWFSSKNSAPALVSVASCGGGIGMYHLEPNHQLSPRVSAFSMGYLQWLQTKVRDMSGEHVTIRSALEHHGSPRRTPSWITPGSLKITGSTATSVQLAWQAPQEHKEDVQRYLVGLERGADVVQGQFLSSDKLSTNLIGLSSNVAYTACITPVGSGGPAPYGAVKHGGVDAQGNFSNTFVDHSPSCINVKLDPAPTAVIKPTITIIRKNFGAVGTWPTEQITWQRPSTPSLPTLLRYRVEVTSSLYGTGSIETQASSNTTLQVTGPVRTVRGERLCTRITPISSPFTAGPTSPAVCTTVQ